MKVYKNLFNLIINPESLFLAWGQFRRGKQHKTGVQEFERNLERHIFQLHHELKNKIYRHRPYIGFYINDPKRRLVHKATIRDRILHHALFKILNLVFDPTFVSDSFSCRIAKGTHKGVTKVEQMLRAVSGNYSRPCYVLKCDVRKFFDSINHTILLSLLEKKIKDPDLMWLLTEIIESYPRRANLAREREKCLEIGVPIGNLTSQLFANVYLNEFDRFVKHELKVEHYARYTDDFVIVSNSRACLEGLIMPIRSFLRNKLRLELHPRKVEIRKFSHGVDFLGYVLLPHHQILRAKTRRRMFRKVGQKIKDYKLGQTSQENLQAALRSYSGIVSHSNGYKLDRELKNFYWFNLR